MRRLASAKRFQLVEEILEEQKKYYKDMSKEGFAARLISLYGKCAMFENAHRVFDEMPENDCPRTVLSLNALLAASANSKKFDKVEELFRDLTVKLSIEPDVISYNILMKALCEMGSLDFALSVLDEMEEKGVEPDKITFNSLLDGLYGNGRFSDGEIIWERMMKKNISPDIRTYNIKLHGLASEKRTKEAVDLVEIMEIKGIKPDVYSLNALVKGFVNEGNLEEAKRSYEQIKKSDFDPDKVTFALLIPFACDKGDLDFAFELCKDIFNIKCRVNVQILQLAVNEMVNGSKIEEAKEIVQLGKKNKYLGKRLQLPNDKHEDNLV